LLIPLNGGRWLSSRKPCDKTALYIRWLSVGIIFGGVSERSNLKMYLANSTSEIRLHYMTPKFRFYLNEWHICTILIKSARLSVKFIANYLASHIYIYIYIYILYTIYIYIYIYINIVGDRGSTVVKLLCYKSEGRWFDPSWCLWILHWHKILPIALWPWGRLSL